ncbi:MAG: hypothetical protein IV100_31230 [Myxococcales bacterium]|nr:hypothetical protein [Myxococcales bacterium]
MRLGQRLSPRALFARLRYSRAVNTGVSWAPGVLLLSVVVALVGLYSVPAAVGLVAFAAAGAFVRGRSMLSQPVRDDPRVVQALRIARRELDALDNDVREETTQPDGPRGPTFRTLRTESPFGSAVTSVKYAGDAPLVEVEIEVGCMADLTFVVRRRRSVADLAPLVENTIVPGHRTELRLRRMPLPDSLTASFDAATSRPRWFRDLVDTGLASLLGELADDPHFRIEDLVFDQDRVRILFSAAGEPATSPWFYEVHLRAHRAAMVLHRLLVHATDGDHPDV